jgi:hypothetical protein
MVQTHSHQYGIRDELNLGEMMSSLLWYESDLMIEAAG